LDGLFYHGYVLINIQTSPYLPATHSMFVDVFVPQNQTCASLALSNPERVTRQSCDWLAPMMSAATTRAPRAGDPQRLGDSELQVQAKAL